MNNWKSETVETVESFKSYGLAFLNAPEPVEEGDTATVIIVGVARSGTSMVAACLRAFGVFMGGEKLGQAVHEDVEIANLIETGEIEALKSLVAERNAQHSIWGFKRPMAFRTIGDMLELFRNPRLVVTFRDPVAIAKRNEISMHMPFLSALRLASEQSAELVEFVENLKHPAMLVSYEKALFEPNRFASDLASFCGLAVDEALAAEAAASIENGPALYLGSSRLKFEGRLTRVSDGFAYGWAFQVGQRNPRKILIRSGDKIVGRGAAEIHRPDLEKAGKADGRCAFKIKLSDDSLELDNISALIEGTTYILQKRKI